MEKEVAGNECGCANAAGHKTPLIALGILAKFVALNPQS